MPVLSIIVSVYIQYMAVHICNTCIEESKKLIVGNKDFCHKNTTYFKQKIARNRDNSNINVWSFGYFF